MTGGEGEIDHLGASYTVCLFTRLRFFIMQNYAVDIDFNKT